MGVAVNELAPLGALKKRPLTARVITGDAKPDGVVVVPASAQPINYPCEVSGQLTAGDDRDWFAIDARRGEVLFIEGLGQRIDSAVDLDVAVLDAAGQTELMHASDELRNTGGKAFPTEDGIAAWIRDPQAIDAHSAMPALGISETQARLMARYLLAH